MLFRPTSSFELQLPQDITTDIDDRVCSLWRDASLLLQLSSYRRLDAGQVSAKDHLNDTIARTAGDWVIRSERLCAEKEVDQAIAQRLDGELSWLHCWFVWPPLAIYATLTGVSAAVHAERSWALEALRSLTPTVACREMQAGTLPGTKEEEP